MLGHGVALQGHLCSILRLGHFPQDHARGKWPFRARGLAGGWPPLSADPGEAGIQVPTRRIFELIIVTEILFLPARSTLRLWGKKQLAIRQLGSPLHLAGEVIVTLV